MNLSPIVTPQGEAMWSAGGNSWKTRVHRGFVCSLEWIGEGKKSQPAMVIWPASNVFASREGSGLWVIGRRAITEFVGFNKMDKCTGGPSEHCLREARLALPILGKDINDKEALHALVSVVVTFAPELVMMPATPQIIKDAHAAQKMWDVSVTNKDTGKTLSEVEL
jgi:hypothetical protein